MSEVITAIQKALAIVAQLREITQENDSAEIKILLADLSNELADIKLEATNLQLAVTATTTNPALKPQVNQGIYEIDNEEGFFCAACFEADNKKTRVKSMPHDFLHEGKWECPVCNASAERGD